MTLLLGHENVKRVGLKATDKLGDKFQIEIELNLEPDFEWIHAFKRPHEYKHDEAHPKQIHISGNKLMFYSSERKLDENLQWIDNYINQANESYCRKKKQEADEINKKQEQEAKKKEELDRINKLLAEK